MITSTTDQTRWFTWLLKPAVFSKMEISEREKKVSSEFYKILNQLIQKQFLKAH